MTDTDTMIDDARALDGPLHIGGVEFASRLIVGTGKYKDFAQNAAALDASGAEIVTVAVRRIPQDEPEGERFLDYLDTDRYVILPNTAGCFDAESAVRTARLAREMLDTDLIKLEVLGDQKTLLPEPVGTLQALETIKIILGKPRTLTGRLLLIEAAGSDFMEIQTTPRDDCGCCGAASPATAAESFEVG